jgi:cobalt-zinc-cadmium efflux system outer membrane protein
MKLTLTHLAENRALTRGAWGVLLTLGMSLAQAQVVVSADAVLQSYLPAEVAVKDALLASPLIEGARARRDALNARAQGIAAGTAEFTVRATAQRRREVGPGVSVQESMLSLERPLRAWGKRGMDADLAAQTQALAVIAYADAVHEGSRELLKLWFEHLRAQADVKNAHTTFALAAQMQRLTQSQLKQGEISKLDAELAQAELDRISAARAVAQAQLGTTTSALSRRYPTVELPHADMNVLSAEAGNMLGDKSRVTSMGSATSPLNGKATLPTWPEDVNVSMAHQRQEFLEKNHELNMLRVDAQRLRLSAQRASRDRLPDPTVGLFTARERAGSEQVTGVMLSMPLSGEARSHHAAATAADAQAAEDQVRWAEQQLSATFESMWQQLLHKRNAAELLKSAALRQAQAADKARKGYALGEGSLSEVLMMDRLASDNLHAAERMQLEAVELQALIRLDLHQMWDFDD